MFRPESYREYLNIGSKGSGKIFLLPIFFYIVNSQRVFLQKTQMKPQRYLKTDLFYPFLNVAPVI